MTGGPHAQMADRLGLTPPGGLARLAPIRWRRHRNGVPEWSKERTGLPPASRPICSHGKRAKPNSYQTVGHPGHGFRLTCSLSNSPARPENQRLSCLLPRHRAGAQRMASQPVVHFPISSTGNARAGSEFPHEAGGIGDDAQSSQGRRPRRCPPPRRTQTIDREPTARCGTSSCSHLRAPEARHRRSAISTRAWWLECRRTRRVHAHSITT